MRLDYTLRYACWILFLTGHQQMEETNDCGTLLYREPAFIGRDVHFRFTPKKAGGSVTWFGCGFMCLVRMWWSNNEITDKSYRRENEVDGNKFHMTTVGRSENKKDKFAVEYAIDGDTCQSEEIILSLKEETSDCGTLLYREPAFIGRDVYFRFTPKKAGGSVTLLSCSVVWCDEITDGSYGRESDVDGTKFSMTTVGRSEDNKNNFEVDYTIDGDTCKSEQIVLHLKELTGCGYLYIRAPPVVENEDTDIVFVPGPQYTKNQSLWKIAKPEKIYKTLPQQNGEVYSKRHDTIYDEYILTIHNITTEQAGYYTMQCRVYPANAVYVNILVKPSNVSLQPLASANNCSQCLIGALHSVMRMRCIVLGGSPPITALIQVGSPAQTVHNTEVDGEFRYAFTMTEDLHGTQAKCTITNRALLISNSTHMVVSASIYVTVKPGKQELSVGPLKEDHPAELNCSATGGRPAPTMAMTLDNQRLNLSISNDATRSDTVASGNDAQRYTLRMSRDMSRTDNRKRLSCCLEHPALVTPLCVSKTLNVKFPSAALRLEKPQFPRDDSHYYPVHLSCTSIQSDPACSIRWQTGIPYNVEGNVQTGNVDGYNVTNRIALNVTQHMAGNTVTCTVACPDFPDVSLVDTYVVQVPFAPIVSVNVSSTTPLVISTGVNLVIECSVRSFPPSTVQWRDESGADVTWLRCGEGKSCLSFTRTVTSDGGTYICEARNPRYNTTSREVYLHVKEQPNPSNASANEEHNVAGSGTSPWLPIVIIAIFAIVTASVITTLLIMKRRRRTGACNHQHELPLEEIQRDDIPVEAAGAAMGGPAGIPDNSPVMYATVVPKSQRTPHEQESKSELVYADLDLDVAPSTSVIRKTSATVYTTVDFTQSMTPQKEEGRGTDHADYADDADDPVYTNCHSADEDDEHVYNN